MKPLELSLLNLRSPYSVWNDAQGLHLKTDHGIVYMVEFCPHHQHYVIRTAVVMDEGIPNYIALIIPRTHPELTAILQYFDNEITIFKENKPQ